MATENNITNSNGKQFPIVAIGASAGGLEAVTELLKNLSPTTGMAYVYIQHLDPNHESSLSMLLQRHTDMKVQEVTDQMKIEPNHVYIIPPNKEMLLVDGSISISERPLRPVKHYPIDRFFLSLAERENQNAIGIILSGTASDGALGLKAIKEAGGLTYAQDESAKYQGMPKSALAEDAVEAVMSPAEMAKELERLSNMPVLLHTVLMNDVADEKPEAAPGAEDPVLRELPGILGVLKASTGVDFSHYKMNTVRRRIIRRMLLYKYDNLGDYQAYLKKTPEEVTSLYKDLLINVTSFFRDMESAEYLKKQVLPGILRNKSNLHPLRIWVPACSTGEEAYSMAMMIIEILGENDNNITIQIFGTDLSQSSIAKARTGLYSESEMFNISPRRVQRFFTKIDGHYRINKSIRDLCVFAPHNVFNDPPFSRLDLVSCCNLLIYLDNVLQKKILGNFHYALNKGGFLVLGKSETVGSSTKLFSQVDKRFKVYTKRDDVESRVTLDMHYQMHNLDHPEPRFTRKIAAEPAQDAQLDKLVDHIFLSRFAPAGVVITYDMDIVQFRGTTSMFLEPSPGRASLNLLKMARSGLAIELRNAVHKVINNKEPVKRSGIEIKYQGKELQVGFEVMPLETSSPDKHLLVIFHETNTPQVTDTKGSLSKDRRVKQLEADLIALREDMRSIVEGHEAANEELQSANEEIVSSNEELQSINEELETSKEELESSNEELITMNQELLLRNEQLAESQEYTEAVISTIRESVLILDKNLTVKSVNKAFYDTFRTSEEETEEKLIYELANGQWNLPALREMFDDLLLRKTQFNGFELRNTFKGVGEKVLILNARKITQKTHDHEFILVAIEDITEHRKVARLLEEREAWFRNMANQMPVMLWVAGPDKNFKFLNNTWLDFTGSTIMEETGNGWTDSVHKDDLQRVLTDFHSSFTQRKPFKIKYRMKRHDGEYRWILNTAAPTYGPNKEFTGYAGSCIEIHDEKLMNKHME